MLRIKPTMDYVPYIPSFQIGDPVYAIEDEVIISRAVIFDMRNFEHEILFDVDYDRGKDLYDVPIDELLRLLPLQSRDTVSCLHNGKYAKATV
jgi:hypothetical protein